jgi:hypothetical protein
MKSANSLNLKGRNTRGAIVRPESPSPSDYFEKATENGSAEHKPGFPPGSLEDVRSYDAR